jgi:hypothetical protein
MDASQTNQMRWKLTATKVVLCCFLIGFPQQTDWLSVFALMFQFESAVLGWLQQYPVLQMELITHAQLSVGMEKITKTTGFVS